MADFSPKKINSTSELNNGKGEYVNGVDVPNADDWNKVIESQLYTQGLAKDPDVNEIGGEGTPSVEITTHQDGSGRLKFKNLKGKGIKSLTEASHTQSGNYTKNTYLVTYTDGTTQNLDIYAAAGVNGSSVTIRSKAVEYAASQSGTEIPSSWSATIPSGTGAYFWTRTTVTYSDNTSTVAYSVARNGTSGASITSITVTKVG